MLPYAIERIMQLILQNLLPLPFRQKLTSNSSDIWLQNLHFKKGEHIALIAPNGNGKSLFFKILNGLYSDYDGTVILGDKVLKSFDQEQLAKMRALYISTVSQQNQLFSQLTVWENLELKRTLTQTIEAPTLQDMMKQLGVYEKRDALCASLSLGELQRVAIIRSLLQPFDWLLLDDSFQHLDHLHKEKAAMMILKIAERNHAGIIMATIENNDYFHYHKKLYL